MIKDFILHLRKKRNLTKEFLASEIGVTRPTYDKIERGESDMTIPQAQKLAAVLGISFEDFVREKETVVVAEIEKEPISTKKEENEIRISIPQQKMDKFNEVLKYILKKVGGKPNVGMTVLYKLLYFIDFDYYEKYEEQLMGLTYLKNQYGPTPLLFENLIKEMVKKGEVEQVKSKFYIYPQTKFLINPTVEPDLSILNGQEKDHIDSELQKLSDLTATALTELSHKDVPWITAENGRPINYESVFYRTADTSVRDYGDDED